MNFAIFSPNSPINSMDILSLKMAFNKIVIFLILILLIYVHVKSVWFCVCVCLPQSLSVGIFKYCLDRSFWLGLFLNTLFRDSCGMKYVYNVSLHWCIERLISFSFSFLLKFDIVSCHLLKLFIICRRILVEIFFWISACIILDCLHISEYQW